MWSIALSVASRSHRPRAFARRAGRGRILRLDTSRLLRTWCTRPPQHPYPGLRLQALLLLAVAQLAQLAHRQE